MKNCYQAIFSFLILLLYPNNLISQQENRPSYSDKHVKTRAEFKKKYFLDATGSIALSKLNSFISRLKKEKEEIENNYYETKILEKIELDLKTLEESEKETINKQKNKKNKYTIFFDQHLIKKLEEIKKNLEEKNQNFQKKLDDFIDLYSLIFIPSKSNNPLRKKWGSDYDHLSFIKNIKGYTFQKKNQVNPEANNLIADEKNIKNIKKCLKKNIGLGKYLTENELKRLQSCQFDLGLLNPAKNPFWKAPLKNKSLNEIDELDIFPKEGEKLLFKRIKFSGHISPKISTWLVREKSKQKIKVKMGHKVHSEIAVSHLAKLIGFNQDQVKYYPSIKISLGKTSYEAFSSSYIRKYDNSTLPLYISSHGSNENGDWIEVKDVLLEAKDINEIRLGSFDPEGWDLPNRREHRGEILFLSWLSIISATPSNYKMILRKKGDKWTTQYRLHDPGLSLNQTLTVHKLDDISKLINLDDKTVNLFSHSILENKKDSIHLYWNDLTFRNKKRFASSTYSDLKWMARKIASLSESEIHKSLELAGFPKDSLNLYYHKIRNRRNEIVRAFELGSEYETFNVPDLASYSPNENIKKGKLIKTNYPGHTEINIRRNYLFTILLERFPLAIPLMNIDKKFSLKLQGAQINSDFKTEHFENLEFSPGVRIILGRFVETNKQRWNKDGKSHPFAIHDSFGIEVGLSSKYIKELRKIFGISIQGNLSFFKSVITHTHYGESRMEGFKKPFNIFKIIGNFKESIAYLLGPGENISRADTFGFNFGLEASVHNPGPDLLELGVDNHLSYLKTYPIHFFRDHQGTLHLLKEKRKDFSTLSKFDILKLNLPALSLSLIGFEKEYKKTKQEAKMYAFHFPKEQENQQEEFDILTRIRTKNSFRALRKILSDSSSELTERIHQEYALKSKAKMKSHRFGFMFLGNKQKSRTYVKTDLVLSDGTKHQFHRFSSLKRENKFFDKIPLPDNEDLLIPKGNYLSIQVEAENSFPRRMSARIKSQDYLRKIDRDELLTFIKKQNNKYSPDREHKFYPYQNLPAKDEIDIYRKVYAESTTYFSDDAISHKLLSYHPEEIESIAKDFLPRSHLKVKKLVRQFRKMKETGAYQEKFLKHFAKFLELLKTRKYGIHLLKRLLGQKNIFVYGQIYGVYRSYNRLQTNEKEASLRFAANHWGSNTQLSPLYKFLKEQNLCVENVYVDHSTDFHLPFGELPRAKPPMY